MKYYKSVVTGNMFVNPQHKEGSIYYKNAVKGTFEEMTEVTNPIFNGKPLAQHSNLDKVARDANMEFYSLYKETPNAEGIYLSDIVTIDDKLLSEAKATKLKEIDTQTGIDIELIVGDNNKQKDKLAESTMLARLESKGTANTEQIARLDALEGLSLQVVQLKIDGNTREDLVALITLDALEADGTTLTYPTVENAVIAVGLI